MKRSTYKQHHQTSLGTTVRKNGTRTEPQIRGHRGRTIRDLCTTIDLISDAEMERDHEYAPLPIHPFQDRDYKRDVVLTYNNWYRVISDFEQDRGWGEGENYDSSGENTTATQEK